MARCLDLLASPCLPILISYFLESMWFVGTIKVVGILFEDMATSLNTTVTEFGLSLGVYTLFSLSPVPFVLIAYRNLRCPLRVQLLFGAVMASMGLILASFATSTWHVTLCLSMTAFGLCIQEAYLVMMLMEELTDNFNFLFCLASSGCGVGMVLPPLLAEVLRTTYGWRDALLILGAIMANIIPCLQCIRPRRSIPGDGDAKDNGNHHTQNNDRGTVQAKVRCRESSPTNTRTNRDGDSLKHHGESRVKHAKSCMRRDEQCSSDKREEATSSTLLCIKGDPQAKEPFAHIDHTQNDAIGGSEGCEEAGCSYLSHYGATRRNDYHDDSPTENYDSSSCEESSVSLLSRTCVADVSSDRRSLLRSKNYAIPAGNKYVTDRQDCNDMSPSDVADDDGDDDRYDKTRNRKTTSAKEIKQKQSENSVVDRILDTIHAFRATPFYTDVWGNCIYVVSLVCGIIYSGWHAFLIPHALERGITPYYVLIITTFAALGNFSGRVLSGILTSNLVSPASLFLMLCPVDSLLLLGYAYIDNEITMAVISCLSAVAIAVRVKVPLLVAKERTSADMYHYVYGAIEMTFGAGSLLGGLVPGLVVDRLSSYDAAFKLLAAVEVAVFFLMLPLRLVKSPN